MKIGVDIRVLMDKHYSGVSEYSANLLTAILNIDCENTYKLFYNSWSIKEDKFFSWLRKNTKIKACRFSNKLFNYILQKIFHYPKLDKFVGGTDIFWSPHFNFSSFSDKTKKIITVHDLSFLRYREFFSWRKNFWHLALAVKKNLKLADRIIAVSENTKNDLIELLGISEEKISVVYSGNNFIKASFSEEERDNYFKEHKIKERFVLYLGNIEPRKNISGLIEAFNNLRSQYSGYDDLQLVLAGAKGWKTKKIIKAAKNSPFYQDIIFLGYVSSKEKSILYQSASLFVYPSFYEGFGFPPLEAMSCGLPVICSNVSSLPEVVSDAALLIDPGKSEEITFAMHSLLSDSLLADFLRKKGLERANFFSWEKAAKSYLDIFKKEYGG